MKAIPASNTGSPGTAAGHRALIVLSLGLAIALTGALAPAQAQPPVPPGTPSSVVPSTPAPKPSGAHIQFSEPNFDFGEVNAGDPVRHDFVFKNTGDAVLELTDVRPGCGCTAAGEWDRRVEPGASGKIPIAFRSTGFSGPVTKGVTVTCNDPKQGVVTLTLRGKVSVPLQVNPPSAMFQFDPDAATSETKVIKIIGNLAQPLTLSEPHWSNRAFRVELKPVKPGKEYDLLVSTVPPLGSNSISAPITLTTSYSNSPSLSVQAYAMPTQPLLISPSILYLPAGSMIATNRLSVLIRANTTNNLVVSDATLDLPDTTVDLREIQPGRAYTVTVVLPPGTEIPAGKRPQLSVKSNHPRFPLIQVPIMARPQPLARPAKVIRPAATATNAAAAAVRAVPSPVVR